MSSTTHPFPDQALFAVEKVQAVLAYDLDGRIVDVNQRYLDICGYRREELVGQPLMMLNENQDSDRLAPEDFMSALCRGAAQKTEAKHVGRGGESYWVFETHVPVMNEAGQLEKVVILALDQTKSNHRAQEHDALQRAVDRSQAVIEFKPNGEIITANDNFLKTFGYTLGEIKGRHHSIFCDPAFSNSIEYRQFWTDLENGYFQAGEFHRMAKGGRDVWVVASYNPVVDKCGNVLRVVKYAADVTARKRALLDKAESRQAAVSRSQAVIEFKPTGEIITANENFLTALGYTLPEIQGRHHSMFCDPSYTQTAEYRQFWMELEGGRYQTGEYRRVAKGGRDVWIVASYNPVLDEQGNVSSVIKYATDVTPRKRAVNELIVGLDKLAHGDLTPRISDAISSEFESVRESFNLTLDSFTEMVEEIRNQAEAMNTEAGQIARGAGDLARRGESQAASLEETASAVEQISGNIAMTSSAANDADAAARDAQQVVLKGAEVVSQAIAAIERIDEHTKQMGEFTRVIEGFAFQTNLLSINAAVEAARAGEVGRGFAVVANEVRNLAQQSAKASQSIADLINKSETEVKAGVKLVRDAGSSLNQIREAVAGMVENIAGIAHATSEQATGVREVSQALSQLDSVNQANLSMSEQYAAAAASLSSQVEDLGAMMDRFDTGAEAPAPTTRRFSQKIA
ncbi:methyl-accepting chemotaxis protein [Paracoccus aminophilus]|uniref:Methyl-accepting chemotaxis sensory transducer with Pas/Pac sensor n=1 Tax=Paracoccus aminophilus JCM 7686 TaxID=1367847 RepID=S5XL56_PARAH|nr:PAS domain S-box protein [Paracoccus aminophilus]AGT07944.1 methyl-accepting chemotaxis sensory transducer with Pas/Pac sensor [Paracoccus aminophilus JCM 7686]